MREFHISKSARDLYEVEDTLFALRGNVVFANFNAARMLAQKMNSQRDLVRHPEQAAHASHLNALGLLDEIFHIMVNEYRQQVNYDVFEKALSTLDEVLGREEVDTVLTQFAIRFPTTPVYRNQIQPEQYFLSETDGTPNRQIILEELMMLWLDNENPAADLYRELFSHDDLVENTSYLPLLNELYDFFQAEPGLGENSENLLDVLRQPALASPDSLEGQLEYINRSWGKIIGPLIDRLLYTLDFIHEETKPIFGVGGPGPAQVLEFQIHESEPENFSPDLDWMPNLILLAKNTYVWLDQLSKKYKKPIQRLDDIPDEELLSLAKWGFTGLWLIGLWERSPASQQIKQMRGNPEAVASAYSLYDYQIANDIGGEDAYQILRDRAWQYGIRLSADMVPNHMGIDSRWVIEHPDWFISLDYSPFPTYSFSGVDLSADARVGIFLEDHYYDNSDAAVVFKRLDRWTGSEKFIYHGNDGTSMPWNDTAQLNYLLPEVREAVIQTILEVARKFPVIRFDAAMTLSKKHYQRLWFPEPGTGGDIPSRAEFGLSREQFDTAVPVEFWREVVDRVAQEVPDTLLLAEAFWLMEGYFVRTLGMHRVYNSAFMNMLRDEKNAQYRLVIKNTIEFDPEILKRYVNFMNNPDERTTIDQFGAGDKYFGICVLLATMPGLPMFGHGQIEGFSEKYGMEYQKAYWNEPVNVDLVRRHEKEIFPILRKRRQFAEVENFLLYDYYLQDGSVNEDVYAFSNLSEGEKSLVIYNNRFGDTSGWIKSSVSYAVKSSAGEAEKDLIQRDISQGLELGQESDQYLIFRDQISGLEYIRNCRDIYEHGLYFELKAYQYHVFLDFRQITDTEWQIYAQLAAQLNGKGVPDMDEALKELILQPLLEPFGELVNPGMFRWIASQRLQPQKVDGSQYLSVLEEVDLKMRSWLSEVQILSKGSQDYAKVSVDTQKQLSIILRLPVLDILWVPNTKSAKEAINYLGLDQESSGLGSALVKGNFRVWGLLLSWLYTHPIGLCLKEERSNADKISRIWLDDWLLSKVIRTTMLDIGIDGYTAGRTIDMLRILVLHHGWWRSLPPKRKINPSEIRQEAFQLIENWLKDKSVQLYIGMNQFEDKIWYNKEAFEELIWWNYLVSVIEIFASSPAEIPPGPIPPAVQNRITNCYSVVKAMLTAEAQSEYQTEKLISYFTNP